MSSDMSQIKIRVPIDVKRWLTQKVKERNRSYSFVINEAIIQAIKIEEITK